MEFLIPGSQVIIYFVQDSSSSNKDMRKAFTVCQENKLKPKVISEEEINDVSQGINVVFVFEEFSGEAFKIVSATDCLVVGPKCLHYCVTNRVPIPLNESPVFSMGMKGVIATASRLPKSQKEKVASLVGYMGGSYTDQLTAAVTHLISDEGRSPKCQKAVEHGIPIMVSQWVKAVWEESKTRDVSITDPEFSKYKLPPFKGMHVSCSNLSQAIKKKVQAAVEANGGGYMAALEQNKTTALIIGDPDGKKFQAAQLWGVPCLQKEWVFDSVEKGMALPTKNYVVTARPKCSTPTNELPSFMSNSDVSCIPFAGESANNTVNETNSSFASISSFKGAAKPSTKHPMDKSQTHKYKELVEKIDLVEAAAAGFFLDGCKVFLSGFGTQEHDKMKKLINKSGATLFPEISDRLSHVIMGEFLPEHVKELEKLVEKPQVVSVEWILASIRLKTAAPSEPYLCFKYTTKNDGQVPPASPLSHKGLSLLKSNSNEGSPKVSVAEGSSTSRKLFVKAPVVKKNIISQGDEIPVLKSSDFQSLQTSVAANDRPASTSSSPPRQKALEAEPPAKCSEENDTCSLSSTIDIGPFFKGLVFLVIGFNDPMAIIESIFAVGGKVESINFQGVADYAVVPLNGISTQLTATEIVTPLWVEDCYEQNKVVDVEYFHQPVALKFDASPLKGCVICVSGYLGKERTFIFHLAGALGALVQDSFSRKDHPAKNIYKSTHLVCKTPTGSKYNAAIKWGVPVINEGWLLACVSSGSQAQTDLYTLESEKGPVEPVMTPINPAILRVKATGGDMLNSIIGTTPNRIPAAVQPQRVDETAATDVGSLQDHAALNQPESAEDNSSVSTKKVPEEAITSNARDDTGPKITPRSSLNNTTVDNFVTPVNNHLKRLSKVGSAGKSPFHIDTPTTPYGQVFMDNGKEPSPSTRKKWKRFIDNLPDLYEGSPEVVEFRKRCPSTPLNVIMKQVWVKFGGAEIEGIDPHTGDLLPNGPYAEWAHKNKSVVSCEAEQHVELSHLKSRLSSVLTPSQQRADENEESRPASAGPPNLRSGSWITPKGIDKQASQTEVQWDFGKPTMYVTNQNQNACKRLRLSSEEADKSLDDQVSKLFEKDEKTNEKKRSFVLSQMSASAREKFEGIIKSLGGEVCTSPCFDPKSTHLIIEKILRSEKLLCAVASGKWVLHSSYLTQCYQSRMFLPEEDYEWGNERSKDRLPILQPGTAEWNLARAVHFWRVRTTDMGQPDAFRNFKAVVLTSENKVAQYMRLLQAGNASVLPKERILEATHVFWDEDKVALPIDKSALESHKIPLLKPVYLGDYLAKNPPPSVEEYSIR